MAFQMSGQVVKGTLPNWAAGASAQPFSQDQFGASLTSELNARYANLVLSGSVFGVTFASASLAAPSATATGAFSLFNPANSGKNLVLLQVGFSLGITTASTTAANIGFQFVPNQTPTAVTAGNTPQNALIGSGNISIAKAYTAGTLVGAPTVLGYTFQGFYSDLAASDFVVAPFDIGGAVIIAPGSGIDINTSVAVTTIVGTFTLIWAELPI